MHYAHYTHNHVLYPYSLYIRYNITIYLHENAEQAMFLMLNSSDDVLSLCPIAKGKPIELWAWAVLCCAVLCCAHTNCTVYSYCLKCTAYKEYKDIIVSARAASASQTFEVYHPCRQRFNSLDIRALPCRSSSLYFQLYNYTDFRGCKADVDDDFHHVYCLFYACFVTFRQSSKAAIKIISPKSFDSTKGNTCMRIILFLRVTVVDLVCLLNSRIVI